MAAKKRTSKRKPTSKSRTTKRSLKEFENAISELQEALKTLRKVQRSIACDPCDWWRKKR